MKEDSLLQAFSAHFPQQYPYGKTKAPGRVNLIGEHTDYNGLPVLPMAICRSIRTVFAPREDSKVVLRNLDPHFPEREFDIKPDIEPYPTGDWGNYAKAAVWKLVNTVLEKEPRFKFRGMSVLVHGDIPKAAGLSSSSALVVSIGLAFSAANDLGFSPEEMAKLMASAERYVGTAGGGMDQTICLLAQENCALKIEFFPELATQPVSIPEDYHVVVFNSLVTAPKTERVRLLFNMRAKESELATRIVSRHLVGVELGNLGELILRYGNGPEELYRKLSAFYRVSGHRQGWPRIELSLAAFTEQHMRTGGREDLLDVPDSGFALWPRSRHALTEGHRVRQAFAYLKAGDAERFGDLMNASHQSCAVDYGISCAELDQLVTLARQHGARSAADREPALAAVRWPWWRKTREPLIEAMTRNTMGSISAKNGPSFTRSYSATETRKSSYTPSPRQGPPGRSWRQSRWWPQPRMILCDLPAKIPRIQEGSAWLTGISGLWVWR